jgi:carnitine 3-dehydrogenase
MNMARRIGSSSDFAGYRAAGRTVSELDRRRDDLLVARLDLVQKYWPEAEGLEGRI